MNCPPVYLTNIHTSVCAACFFIVENVIVTFFSFFLSYFWGREQGRNWQTHATSDECDAECGNVGIVCEKLCYITTHESEKNLGGGRGEAGGVGKKVFQNAS